MILKFKTQPDGELIRDQFKYISDVEQISRVQEAIHLKDESAFWEIAKNYDSAVLFHLNGKEKPTAFVKLYVQLKGKDKLYRIITQGHVYLMNDSGETIEKIN